MQASQTPTLVPLAFAANGTKNAIPEASQIGITPGAASLNDGFPPLTFTPIAAGGVPPAGADFNGVLNLITQSIRWAHGGGHYSYNSAFASDTNVAGYPRGALLLRSDQSGMWLNQTDGNTANPDTGGANWSAAFMSGTVGQVRNLSMSVTAASASATLTADEIVVGSALGGQKYVLGSFSKTINLATTGAGGMDAGSAPVSGYVALYAILNPTTGATALLATNATSTIAPNVYGGANMPAGYTASALVSVWPTDSSGRFVVGSQRDRKVARSSVQVLSTTSVVSITALNVSSAIPPNAVACSGILEITIGSSATAPTISVFVNSQGCGQQALDVYQNGSTLNSPFNDLIVSVPSNIYYNTSTTAGSSTYAIRITAYSI